MHVLPVFAPEWDRHASDDEAREAYVSAEIRRLFSAGGAVLLSVLQMSVDDACQMTALRQLVENQDSDGGQLFDPAHLWRLRLKEGAAPPPCDSQGRKLSREELGKTLVTSVGNLGGTRGRERETKASVEWGGQRRSMKASAGQDIYAYRKVTSKAQAFTLNDAVLILRRWGIGVQPKQHQRNRKWRQGESNEDLPPGQDLWLVEEVPRAAASSGAPGDEESATAKRSKAA